MAAAILSSLRSKSSRPFLRLLRLRFFSDSPESSCSASARPEASPDPHFMVEYLMKSCGFSVPEAVKAAKSFAHLRSSEKPDAVLGYLRSQGFGAAHLRKMINDVPRCLCFDVKRTLAPKMESLRSMGFAKSDVVDVVAAQPHLMTLTRAIRPKLEMWESLLGSREILLKLLKSRSWFLTSSMEKTLGPNIKFLTDECRIPEERVSLIVRKQPSIIASKPDTLRALAVRAEKMGLPRGSKMFQRMICILFKVSQEKIEATLDIMRTFGWSEDEFYSAIRRQPCFLSLSKEVLQKRMDFFVNDVGCTPSYIAQLPTILTLSMEKRVLPRLRVVEVLKSKGLFSGQLQRQVSTILLSTDAKFMQRFVHPFEEKV